MKWTARAFCSHRCKMLLDGALLFCMNTPTRRRFLHASALASSAMAFPSLHAQDAGKKLRLGLIGPGGMGTNHLKLLAKTSDVELAWVCDVDAKRLELAAKTTQELSGAAPKTTRDMREVLK